MTKLEDKTGLAISRGRRYLGKWTRRILEMITRDSWELVAREGVIIIARVRKSITASLMSTRVTATVIPIPGLCSCSTTTPTC